jgi:hypothetical protein
VFENGVLRRIFGPKRDEVTGGWRKLHNEELHNSYSSPSIIRMIKSRRMRWSGHVAHTGENRNAYRILVGKPEGKRSLGRPKRRWEHNIVTCITIARQRVGKHIPAKHAHATIGRLLLGNGAVNRLFNNKRQCFTWGPPRGCITRN